MASLKAEAAPYLNLRLGALALALAQAGVAAIAVCGAAAGKGGEGGVQAYGRHRQTAGELRRCSHRCAVSRAIAAAAAAAIEMNTHTCGQPPTLAFDAGLRVGHSNAQQQRSRSCSRHQRQARHLCLSLQRRVQCRQAHLDKNPVRYTPRQRGSVLQGGGCFCWSNSS